MADFTGSKELLPTAGADIWVLDAGATAGSIGKVKKYSVGSRSVNSVGYRIKWSRPTTGASGAFTAMGGSTSNPIATSLCRLGTFGTGSTNGADPAGILDSLDMNALGGGAIIILPIGSEWQIVGTAGLYSQINCQNVQGDGTNYSSYGVQWQE